MTEEETEILKLAQKIYLAEFNRYNDVDGEEADEFIDQTIDWVNQFIPELELEADWNYLRENSAELGTITAAGITSFPIPDGVRKLVISPYRDVTISQDGSVVARFKLVNANQISDPNDPDTSDRATVVGRSVVFSRAFTEQEIGGVVAADVINAMPELARDDTELLELIKPLQLVVLGVAKNATLPDIVQGGISPSLTQKYADLLQRAVAENNATSDSSFAPREDFNFIRGVW